ncbi:helix-turn-helix domain-containing protein [Actinoplanes sp. DH11]|uniref:helix-turn-helix transcriptional regulator n=1 Tax=Actinoplanes sp. DH11 TaxID=2857011 RepID=UPI0035B26EDB
MAPLGITPTKVAVAVGVPLRRVTEIVHGKWRITADTALRLARYFGTTELSSWTAGPEEARAWVIPVGATARGRRCQPVSAALARAPPSMARS